MARFAALEEAVIPLGIEETPLVKACLLKTMIDVCGEDEIILVLHQPEKLVIDGVGRIRVTIEKDVPAPIGPKFFRGSVGIKAPRVHVGETVAVGEITEIGFKPFAAVRVSGGSGETGAGTDHYRLR